MNHARIFIAVLLSITLLISLISLSSCKKPKEAGGDTTVTTVNTTDTADSNTTASETTAADTAPPEVKKAAYELFDEATKQLRESSYLDADFDFNYSYGLSGVPYQTNLKGNSKHSLINDKPVSLMTLNINTNGTQSSATIYSDDAYAYINQNGTKTKSENSDGQLQQIPLFEEDSFFDLRHVTANDVTTFTGKCIGSIFTPVMDLYVENAAATEVKTAQISDVAINAVTDQNGVISKLDYSFEAVLTFPGAVSITVTHSGSITFKSFAAVTVTPPSDLGSYVG